MTINKKKFVYKYQKRRYRDKIECHEMYFSRYFNYKIWYANRAQEINVKIIINL
jgi:hypothetical protein